MGLTFKDLMGKMITREEYLKQINKVINNEQYMVALGSSHYAYKHCGVVYVQSRDLTEKPVHWKRFNCKKVK